MEMSAALIEPQDDFWAWVSEKDFEKIISWLTGKGVRDEDLGEVLLSLARQAISGRQLKSARAILLFLVDALEDKSEAPPLLKLIGDLYITEGQYDKAREYYGRFPITLENIKLCLGTFCADMDINGMLRLRDDILSRVPASVYEHVHDVIHGLVTEIASNPDIQNAYARQFGINIEHLKKINSTILNKDIFQKRPSVDDCRDIQNVLKIFDSIYVTINGVWQKSIQQQPLQREVLGEHTNLAIRCRTIEHFVQLLGAVKTEQPEFIKYTYYIILDFRLLAIFMSVVDLSPMTECDFVFRFIDERNIETHLKELFINQKTVFPDRVVCLSNKDREYYNQRLVPFLHSIDSNIENNIKQYEQRLAALYPESFPKTLVDKVRNRKALRILLMTSRYTTYVQYATRDMADGFRQLGHEIFILKEEDNAGNGIRHDTSLKLLCEFQPDIVFCIDHLRYEYRWIPQHLIFVAWIQDTLPEVMSGEHIKKMTDRDFLLTEVVSEDLVEVGYKDVVRFPVHVNTKVFKGDPENVQYEHDISNVCHAPQMYPFPQETLDELFKGAPEGSRITRNTLYQMIAEQIPEPFNPSSYKLVNYSDYREFLKPYFQSILPGREIPDYFFQRIGTVICNFICKTFVSKWIVDAGYSLSIFGRGWDEMPDFPEFKNCARGVVYHGKQLGEVYNKTKINLSVASLFTSQHRAFEVIASGGFLLVGYIPPEKDVHPITAFLEEGDGYVFFKGKNDLLEKIDYYLNHEEKRIEIIKHGRAKILNNYTVKQGAQKIVDIVSARFS